jgi:hypothetical protein
LTTPPTNPARGAGPKAFPNLTLKIVHFIPLYLQVTSLQTLIITPNRRRLLFQIFTKKFFNSSTVVSYSKWRGKDSERISLGITIATLNCPRLLVSKISRNNSKSYVCLILLLCTSFKCLQLTIGSSSSLASGPQPRPRRPMRYQIPSHSICSRSPNRQIGTSQI